MFDQVFDVCLFDDGYSCEVCLFFYYVYCYELIFVYLMDVQCVGYDQCVCVCVWEMVECYLGEELLVIGLFIDDWLVVVVLIMLLQWCLDIIESWSWCLCMLFSVGLVVIWCYLDYYWVVQVCLLVGFYYQLLMFGVYFEYQGRQIGEQLLVVVQCWCVEDFVLQGLVLDIGNVCYLDFYQWYGYCEIGEVMLGVVCEYVFLYFGEMLVVI